MKCEKPKARAEIAALHTYRFRHSSCTTSSPRSCGSRRMALTGVSPASSCSNPSRSSSNSQPHTASTGHLTAVVEQSFTCILIRCHFVFIFRTARVAFSSDHGIGAAGLSGHAGEWYNTSSSDLRARERAEEVVGVGDANAVLWCSRSCSHLRQPTFLTSGCGRWES